MLREQLRTLQGGQSILIEASESENSCELSITVKRQSEDQLMALKDANSLLSQQISSAQSEAEVVEASNKELRARLSKVEAELVASKQDTKQAEEIASSLNGQLILLKQAIEQRDHEIRSQKQRINLLESAECVNCANIKQALEQKSREDAQVIAEIRAAFVQKDAELAEANRTISVSIIINVGAKEAVSLEPR